MKRDVKKTIAFIFFILGALVLGGFISRICDGHQYLDWLSYGKTIGFSSDRPAVLNLEFLKITFGISLKFTIAQIITVIIAIFTYSKTCKHL